MKRWIALAGILLLACAALLVVKYRHLRAEVSPDPILYFVADTEHELTRIPVSLTRLSDRQEIEIGNQMARRYLAGNELKDAESREIAAYVDRVGSNLAAHAQRKLPYRFHYIPQDSLVNAFALPGGHVFIGKGLLELMHTEDELANVLGHEIEHIDLGHPAERVQIEMGLKKLPLGAAVQIPIQVFEKGYSKEQELQADREGTKLAVATGYSAEGAISMFQSFQKLEDEAQRYRASDMRQHTVLDLPVEIGNVVVLQTVEGYFRSHPPTRERIAQIQQLMVREHWSADQKQKPLAVAYLLLTDDAQRYLARDNMDKALLSAQKALAFQPGYPRALNIVADIDFEKADFAAAAAMYAQSLRADPKQPDLARRYAMALSASLSPAQAAEQFSALTNTSQSLRDDPWFEVEQTGLKLMAGDSASAKALRQRLSQSGSTDAPLLSGRLAWWHYRSGDARTAADLLTMSVEQRPQIKWLSADLGWAFEALKRYESASQMFYQANQFNDRSLRAESSMGVALTEWNQEQHDRALANYRNAVAARSAWANQQWITALYGPAVAATTQAIHAEVERRRQAEHAAK